MDSSKPSPSIPSLEVSPAEMPETRAAPEVGCDQPSSGRRSPRPSLSLPNRKKDKGLSATMPVDRKEAGTMDRAARLQQENLTLSEEVKAQKELVWLLHQALEAAQLEKRTCTQFAAAEGEQARLELLRHGERCAADLRQRLERLRTEGEALRHSLAQRDAHVAELQDSVRLLLEKNQAKQEVILKLSEEVAACADDPHRTLGFQRLNTDTFRHLTQEMASLKDDLEAYKTQNKFLNSEIHQLTKLWQNSSEQEKSLMVKCAYLEASNCQMESRYLGVLRKLQEKKELNAEQKDAVKRLIEDALQADLNDVIQLDTVREYDEYGFKIIPDYEVEDMKLLAKIQALEIRSHKLLHRDVGERPLLARWTQYLGGRSPDDLCSGPELKGLLRAGVPREYRARVWRWMVHTRTRPLRERLPDLFQQLCEKSHATPHPASRQIQLDLHRTLTSNQNFCSPSSPQLQQLHRVLLAFSWQNPTVGYCQGLNRLAAIALLVLQSEEEAFWCLVAIVQYLMPQDYYTKTLLGSQADQRVFKDFMAEKMPRLVAHLEEHGVDVSMITFNWFLVLFVESLPSDILLKVWDAFFYEGTKVIFRYALALFKYNEEEILKLHGSVEIYQYLRFFTKTITDSRKLTVIAFVDLNPFPMKVLRNRRTLHLQKLRAELRELERLQAEYAADTGPHKDKDLDANASEDDDIDS
ncbi:TBC1 domain family member 2A isoform X2 [Brachyhypopomus gauderio]